nr:hypothetical protein [uncultured Rhodopila sp.]
MRRLQPGAARGPGIGPVNEPDDDAAAQRREFPGDLGDPLRRDPACDDTVQGRLVRLNIAGGRLHQGGRTEAQRQDARIVNRCVVAWPAGVGMKQRKAHGSRATGHCVRQRDDDRAPRCQFKRTQDRSACVHGQALARHRVAKQEGLDVALHRVGQIVARKRHPTVQANVSSTDQPEP